MSTTLTDEVMRYKESGTGWPSLYERIQIYIYRYPYLWSDWDEDRCSEFFLAYHPRIPGLVRRFRPDYSFETYLSCSLRWFMKTYSEKLAAREHYESWAADPVRADYDGFGYSGGSADPVEPDWDEDFPGAKDGPFAIDEKGRLKDPSQRRRLLYIAMLKAADLEEERTDAIARLADVDADWLFERTEKVRRLVSERIEKRERLRQRRNEYWFRYDGAVRRLDLENAGEGRKFQEWKRKAHTWKSRYDSVCSNLQRTSVMPTHRQIGRLLEVPPGTVSSGIHLIKKAWTESDFVTMRQETVEENQRISVGTGTTDWTPAGASG